MRDRLAEELLARVLSWTPEEVAAERPVVQALAAYKYDEYQQFSAGSRFIESLALWLNQFVTVPERRVAYEFVRRRLVFCSSNELRHLVEMAYRDHIRPLLVDRIASTPAERHRPKRVVHRQEFRVRQRQCLFLGLSDGARIDAFRRANPELNHEQIWQTYELSADRVDKLLEKLEEHLREILGRAPTPDERLFRTFVLLDDFSASGTSYFGGSPEAPRGGKIASLFKDLIEQGPAARLVDTSRLEVFTLLYMATEQALAHIRTASQATWGTRGVSFAVEAVQVLPHSLRISPSCGDPVVPLVQAHDYYDHAVFDRHFEKGKTEDARFGYAACGLPVVLHHNTPNNSLALLMSYDDLKFRGLFPRVQRHREMA